MNKTHRSTEIKRERERERGSPGLGLWFWNPRLREKRFRVRVWRRGEEEEVMNRERRGTSLNSKPTVISEFRLF